MNHRVVFASALAAIALVGTALPALRGGGPLGTPNVAGSWIGKKAYRDRNLSTTDPVAKGKCPLELNIVQDGEDLFIAFNILCPDDPVKSFNLTGKIGNGHFWAQGTTDLAEGGTGYEIAISGTATDSKIKGTGIFLYGPHFISDVKFDAKRSPLK